MNKFEKLITNRFTFALFLLRDMPVALFAGVKMKELTKERAVSTIKFSYFNKNPFKSIYFACLGMSAELSTGFLVVNHTNTAKPGISTLVVKNSAEFYKKAVGNISFTCTDGALIEQKAKQAIETGEGVLIETTTVGVDEQGDTVAKFNFTWSIKQKSTKHK